MKPKVIAIVGSTASGKSDLAVAMARRFNGEVISADSRQVYKGLDIGTGKITKREMKGVPHHLLNVVSPRKVFTVADYKRITDSTIVNTVSRGKLPILCGGTGFYIDAVVDNILLPEVKPNKKLRSQLDKKSAQELYDILTKLDPRRAGEIGKNNKVRLIRAIEIAKSLGKVPIPKTKSLYEVLYIGVLRESDYLKERIKLRLEKRIKLGMIEEAKKLHKQGLSWRRMNELGLEYRYLALYLQGKISRNEMIEKLNFEIWHYAKRQMTWFRRNKQIKWIDPKDLKKVSAEIQKFLK